MIQMNSFGGVPTVDSMTDSTTMKESMVKRDSQTSDVVLLSTLSGVYLPCVQNILGVILFIRLPWIVAQTGMVNSTVIVFICVSSTVLTSLSMSALATNGKIGAGGSYAILMKNLGPEFAGAVGVLFYLGTTIAVTMYALGGVEALFDNFLPGNELFSFDNQILSLSWTCLLGGIVFAGMQYVAKIGPFFFLFVIVAIVFMSLGAILFAANAWDPAGVSHASPLSQNMWPQYSPDDKTGITPDFISLIALFYPSVTGIMAGSNRSGVLIDPGRSIPIGTIGAILSTTTIYVITIWLFGLVVSTETLKSNKLVAAYIAWPHQYVVGIGIIMSCVGAGLQSLAGAPQLLKSIANDGNIPILNFFKTKNNEEPRRAVVFTTGLAALCCLAGNLDYITPIITMFFLCMYAGINFSCFLSAFLQAPDFRPTWRYFHWSTALMGFLICITLMFLVSVLYAMLSFVLVLSLYWYIRSHQEEKEWGSALFGLRLNQAMRSLHDLSAIRTQRRNEDEEDPTKNLNWRPQILVMCKLHEASDSSFSGDSQSENLVKLASQLKKSRGLTIISTILKGNVGDDGSKSRCSHAKRFLWENMEAHSISGFPDAVIAPDNMLTPFTMMLQSSGLGMLTPNTVMLSWPRTWRGDAHTRTYVSMLKNVLHCGKTLIVTRMLKDVPVRAGPQGTIDVWWLVHDGDILVLLPYLLKRNKIWSRCKLRIFAVVDDFVDTGNAGTMLRNHLNELRINATVEIVPIGTSNVRDIDQNRTVVQRSNSGVKSVKSLFELDGEASADDASLFLDLEGGSIPEHLLKGMGDDTTKYVQTRYNREHQPLGSLFETNEEEEEAICVADSRVTSNMEDEIATQGKDNLLEQLSRDKSRLKKRLLTAKHLNTCILKRSATADMVVLNLPLSRTIPDQEFVSYTEILTDTLTRVIMLRGSGNENIVSLND